MQKRPKGWETARDDPNHVGELLITIDGTQYTGEDIVSCEIERDLLENTVEVGNATAAVLTLEINQKGTIAKCAKVVVQYRLVLDDAKTDYIPQGTYWINTREASGRYLKLTCYDAMLMGQQNYLSDTTADDWPKQESDCAAEIAQRIGVELDSRSSIGTGDNHTVSMPVGRTMRDVLQQIGAANGGNWCITPAGKLYLVPLAGTGDSLPEVSGAPDCGADQSVTGVRVVRNSTDTPLLSGDETGTVLEVENENGTQDLADELARELKGMNYAPYTCDQRHIDPVAEAGDKITIGGTAYVAYNIKMTLGPSHYADLEAPAEAGELEEEYPYLSETKRTQKELETVTKSVSEIRKDQEKIETEVSETKKTVAENQEDIEEARKEAEEKSELAAKQAKEYTDGQLLNYSTTEETKSLIQQTKDSITSEVSKTYATTATVKKAQQDAQDYTDGQLIHYSTTEETKSLIKQTADSIKSEVSKTYATTKTVEDAQQAATGEAKKYTDGKLVSYSTTEETKSLIKQSADSITSEVSKTYATTTVVEQAKKDAENAANGYTDGQLVSYTTKEETKSLIQQSADSIKSEVSKTYATTKTVEDAQQAATGEAKKYTDSKLKDYATNTSVSKIEQKADSITQTVTQRITGGNNLILGSESFQNATYDGNASGVAYGDDGSATITNANTNRYFAFNTVGARITKGVTLCLSVMYKPISGTDGLCLSLTYDADNGTSYFESITTENQLEIEQTDGWVLRYGTWTPSRTGILKTVKLGCGSIMAGVGGSYTNKFSLLHPMLQYGNAPTAWNASSGDYLTQESAKSLFSQTAEEIKTEVTKSVTETVTANVKDTATSAANDAVDSKLQDYATTATVNSLKEDVSSISQKADSISTKVSSLEETTTTISNDLDNTKQEFKTVKESVSAIDQKADSITQTVTQRITGGNNIIVGTDDWNNATLDAGGNDLSKKGTYTISGESVRVTNKAQNTRFHFGADKTLVIAKGMTYCASVLYKLNSGTDSLFLQFETKSTSGTKTYYGSAFKNAKQDIALDNGWKLRWAAFTATADGYADGLFVSTADDNATVTNDLTIMHPMVQMGNAPTAWTASTGDYLTATETKTEIKQELGTIKLTATTNGTSSTLTLAANGANITSANISFTGVVTFNDLSTWNQDKTIINGGNINTGQLHNMKYTTVYDLDNAWIRMGTESGERVYIDNRHIAWYATVNTGSIGLTGVCYSEAGRSYIGANSKYASYGWVDGLDPTKWVGLQVTYNRSDDSDADFNTTRVGISGTLNCRNLNAWGSKSRVVNTSFGALKMAAFETPVPTFADWGRAECNADGWCLIVPDPRYAETVAQHGQLIWMLTDCDGTGHLWAEDCGQYAIVHGAAGQKFAWMCMAAQRGYEGEYAEPSECNYPAPPPEGMELAASAAARALDAGAGVADDLLNTESAKTDDALLEVEEQT